MQTNDVGEVGQAAALNSVVSALQGLESVLAEGRARQLMALDSLGLELERLEWLIADELANKIAALKNFTDDGPALVELTELHRKWLAQLDLFHVLGVADSELHHSRFLRWLLDPQETHGAGDYFLKSFLFQTCATAEKAGLPGMVPSDVHSANWSTTEVRREWQYIDILILNRKARFVCAIENKIWASEGIGENQISQLYAYRMALKKMFPEFTRHHVFLSPTGMLPRNESDQKYWTTENYATVLGIVERMIEIKSHTISEDVRMVLRQYAAALRRNKIVPDANTEFQQRVREVYLAHREVIELINQHKPDLRAEVQQTIKEAVAEQDQWKLEWAETGFVYFRPMETEGLETMDPGWGHSRYPLLCISFRCMQAGHAYFRVEIAPETEKNRAARGNLLNSFNQAPELFSYVPVRGTEWITIHEGEYIVSDNDLNNWDQPSVRDEIKERIYDFAKNQFHAMNEVIVNCLREYEAEAKGQ